MFRFTTHGFTLHYCIGSLLVLLLTAACVTDRSKGEDELLIGRWELVRAERNNAPTESLDNLFFEFLPEQQLRTNFTLTSTESMGTYTFSGDILEQTTPDLTADLTVKELTDSTLFLETRLRGTFFQLYLRRAADQVPGN
ncbi:MAG: hypothetical protein WBA17_16080 [Saprospiraceae bacterium]